MSCGKDQLKSGRPVDVAGFAARKRKQLGTPPQKPSSKPWVEGEGGKIVGKRGKSNHYGSY